MMSLSISTFSVTRLYHAIKGPSFVEKTILSGVPLSVDSRARSAIVARSAENVKAQDLCTCDPLLLVALWLQAS
jgi:hypothetical protein